MDGQMPTVNPLTQAALRLALKSEKPVALKKVGRASGLTPGGRDTAAKVEAREQCLNPRLDLFEKVGGSDDNPLLRIKPAGVELLLAASTPEERGELSAAAAEPLRPAVEAATAKLAASELKDIDHRQAELARRAGELREQLSRMWADQLAGVERALAELQKQAEAIRAQMAAGKRPPPDDSPTPKPPPVVPIDRLRPVKEEDIDFQRDLCRELALVWEDSPEPDARAALERVMSNAGLEQIGEADEVLAFDAGRHKLASGNGVLPGNPVKVVEPGWEFRSPRGVLQIVKPKVAPSSN